EVDERNRPLAPAAADVDDGVEGGERDGHVGRVRRHAVRRVAEHRQVPVLALAPGQPLPGSRLLHGFVTSWKYGQRVRCRRLPPVVAAFRSCPEAPASLREHRVAGAGAAVGREVTVADDGADPEAVARQLLDRAERQPRHVDERGRRLDAEPHQVDEVRAAAEELRLARGTDGRERAGDVLRACVRERPHSQLGSGDVLDRRDDVRVGAAAADVATHALASWSGCSAPSANPSTVTISAPAWAAASARQALVRRPSTRIVHEPHWPWSQPFLAPVSPTCSPRRSSSKLTHEHAPRLVDQDGELAVLQSPRVAYRGQVVGVVVAETSEAAREAERLVRVEYDVEEHDVALRADHPSLYKPDKVNPAYPTDSEEGDVERALADAHATVDATYRRGCPARRRTLRWRTSTLSGRCATVARPKSSIDKRRIRHGDGNAGAGRT